ncbi:MAG: hypothetical protein JXO22_15680, partial [Phycisphaerae bacterium]|nr:hypothetical protein [Phycisphaerae bacterium]
MPRVKGNQLAKVQRVADGDSIAGHDCDPDVSDPNDTSPDRRYFVHQDRNWNVTALTAYNADP